MASKNIITEVKTPDSYYEAINGENSYYWKKAMDQSLKENHTWELTSLPKRSRVIPSKWGFRVKSNPDGSVDKYKARLVQVEIWCTF